MASPPHPPPAAPPACPVCFAARSAADEVCAGCGLVFASREVGLPGLAPAAAALAGGRYVVQRVLSRGGMGAISLALDRDVFGRPVVIKAMLDYYDPGDPAEAVAARERFRGEARTLAGLRHPAIPQIYSYFAEAGRHYIVMEYIAGRDLDAGLSRAGERGEPLAVGAAYPRAQVLRWGVALCKVLEYLASRRPHPVVHHDIKPANLILDAESGELRLVDFGTARPPDGSGGALFGTPGYAPPEQYRGESEPRSDVYALAATLYHLASDDDPAAHPFEFPRLPALGELGRALAPALNREVARRPGAAELRAGLEALLAGPAARPLQAPDGALLDGLPALATWAVANWDAAATWLYADLAEQLAVRRGETSLAARVVAARDSESLQHLALDAALALVDPDGYGAARPALELGARAVDFGRLGMAEALTRTVHARNAGRRCLVARLDLPAWLSLDHAQLPGLSRPDGLLHRDEAPAVRRRQRRRAQYRLVLPPGRDIGLPLRAEMARARIGGRLRAELGVALADGSARDSIALSARTPRLRRIARQLTVAALLGVATLAFGYIVISALIALILTII